MSEQLDFTANCLCLVRKCGDTGSEKYLFGAENISSKNRFH